MKKFFYSLFVALLIGLVIYSCEKNKDNGDAKNLVITGGSGIETICVV